MAATRSPSSRWTQILELRLYQLTGLERDKIDGEYKALIETIKDLLDILAKEARVLDDHQEGTAAIQRKARQRRA